MPAPLDKILFIAASSLTNPEERKALLEQACKDDPALRGRVEKIFAIQGAAADFFEAEPEVPLANSNAGSDEGMGGRIGRYRLIERIGAGGHGAVYLAEQVEPVRRKVALKVIRLGMDTEQVIARFDLERQALAMMDHPNIARVLDAGATASGRPYFVMELVDGEKFTSFCDENRLGIRQRLELFIQVCQAIQHAHQKGVIHRDIKPSNILVRKRDSAFVPKVIDFGIAKAATKTQDDDDDLTTADQFVGTPAYMSPEMAAGGLDVDTRTDIHSLGAVLYELLTGRPPIDPKRLQELGVDEIRRVLREEDPLAPSSLLASLDANELAQVASLRGIEPSKLIHQVKGDLDWIVMKAMERDRNQRYDTSNGLALDVERHLLHEPVTAGPPSRMYRLTKLVRRNKIPFLFGGTVVLLLAAGFGASTYLFLREKDARNQQERLKVEANIAREKAESRGLVAQAAVQVNYGHIEEADRLLAQVPVEFAPPSLEAARAYTAVGEWHVLAGRWQEATDRFAAAALSLTTVDSSDSDAISIALIPAAATLSDAGDRTRYNAVIQVAINRFSGTTHPVVAEQVVKSALLMPADRHTLAAVEPLASFLERSVNNERPELISPHRSAWSSLAIGLMKFRSGDMIAASDWTAKCLSYEGSNPSRDATSRCMMAMIAWKQGRKEEAHTLLKTAEAAINDVFSSNLPIGDLNSFWFDWVNARVLLREARSMMED